MTICSMGENKLFGYFNSHPHEEDDSYRRVEQEGVKHFNSHPHEEDDIYAESEPNSNVISTHILTKRMTDYLSLKTRGHIFQLTSSRRG